MQSNKLQDNKFSKNFTSSKAAMLHYTNGTIMPSKQIFSTLLNLSIFVT